MKRIIYDFFRLLNREARRFNESPLSYEMRPATFLALFWRVEAVCCPASKTCDVAPCVWLRNAFTRQSWAGLDEPIDDFLDLVRERAAELENGARPYDSAGWFIKR